MFIRSRTFRALVAGLTATLTGAVVVVAGPGVAHAATVNATQYVNPLIGTDDSNSPNPVGGGAGGSTYPGAVVPFGGVQFSPDTPTASPSGYRDRDRTIEEFSLTHFNGAGCANNEDLGILPVIGAVTTSPGTNWTSYASAYTKANETASAGYYKNRLDKYSTNVELTATTRTGVARIGFPSGTSSRILINTSRSATGDRAGAITINGSTVTGNVTAGGFCGSSKTYPIFFSIRFDRAPSGVGTWNGGTVSAGSTATSGLNTGGYVTFDTTTNATVTANIALSYVSAANATANLNAEIASFDTVRTAANNSWNTALNRIQIAGGSATDLQKFYTALYHVLVNPNIASDVNGQYRGFDNAIHTAPHPVYQNYSGWDIYRSWAALVALIAPDVMSDIAKSMVLDGQQGGLLPRWSQQTNEDFIMPGDPGPIIVSSAYAFGARNFDTAAALGLMQSSVAGGTTQGTPMRGAHTFYEANHFLANSPSESLEVASSDFAIAQFAKAIGNTTEYNNSMTHAQYWRSSFNSESSYIHPRNSDGSWPWPLDPTAEAPYTEGNASQYSWMVPHNFDALISLMGGPATAVQRLDFHFTQLNGGLTQPYFYIGNEPEHGVPWAYHFAGAPSRTSSVVRRVMSQSFTTGAGGLPGNDDLGATSAWYVWAAMGMYPPTPGADTIALHGPQFPGITIVRSAGNIQIDGGSATSQYVQSVQLNGANNGHSYIRYGDIAGGGTLTYAMGTSPTVWGTGYTDVPPSFTDGATQPGRAPELGVNIALGKPTTSSIVCNSAEGGDKSIDGNLATNSKWCSQTAPLFLRVDLGSTQDVSAFVVKHAGLGGETTGYNTGAFTIRTSTDGTNWTAGASVTGSRSSRTYHPVTSRAARYVQLDVTTPANNGDTAARIYELEVYPSGSPIVGPGGKCVDVAGNDTAGNGGAVQLWDCQTGASDQHWRLEGTALQTLGKCMDTGGATANFTQIQLWECNGTGAQQWVHQADGTFKNPTSGRCLDSPGGATANGTRLQLYDCNASAAQKFTATGF